RGLWLTLRGYRGSRAGPLSSLQYLEVHVGERVPRSRATASHRNSVATCRRQCFDRSSVASCVDQSDSETRILRGCFGIRRSHSAESSEYAVQNTTTGAPGCSRNRYPACIDQEPPD